MGPGLRVRIRAITLGTLALLSVAVPASAQFYDDARTALDLSLGPIQRSPRLLGMGRLTLVADDPHNRIQLWDFAGNPTGILEDDSVSTFELRPGTASASQVHDLVSEPGRERQDLAAREARLGFEAFRRTEGTAAYGVAGELASLRFDRPQDDFTERRSRLSLPSVMPVLTGRMPFTESGRVLYSARLFYAGESGEDEFRDFTHNSAGDYIDQDGTLLGPPNLFTPESRHVRSEGGGLAVAWKAFPWVTAAIGGDLVVHDIVSSNTADRHSSEIADKRPYLLGQATLIGRVGDAIEWGIDGRRWNASSEQRWLFTISAGAETNGGLAGRGKLLDRDEIGSSMRSRVRWTVGSFEVGAGLGTFYRRVTETPPDASDLTSFNHFRNVASYRVNADTLDLADSVSYERNDERNWDGGFGVAWTLLDGRATWGAEYHVGRSAIDQITSGHGPQREGGDIRTGLDWRFNRAFSARAGYQYGWDDLDAETQQNERVSQTVTVGAGIRPAASRWSFESGYAIQWTQADYDDPTSPRSSRQQLATQIRWAF